MSELLSEWVSEWVSEWASERASKQVSEAAKIFSFGIFLKDLYSIKVAFIAYDEHFGQHVPLLLQLTIMMKLWLRDTICPTC